MIKQYRHHLLWVMIPLLSACSYTFYPSGGDYPLPGGLHKLSVLSPELNETSGIIVLDSLYFTFNDSGADAEVFSFTKNTPLIQKTLISNATNIDWEAMAYDGDYFYLADVGNNFGSRDTLKIYKIPSGGIKQRDPVSAASEIITFSYQEQVSRNSTGWYSHDCEAIFAYGDSLYLVSKDWVGHTARFYALPKVEGHYNIQHRNVYEVDALITGSDVNPDTREVALVGYRNYVPVLIVYSFEEDPTQIENGKKVRKYPLRIGAQVEAVCFDENGRMMITAEKQFYKQALYTTY